MAKTVVKLTVKFSWWVRPYLWLAIAAGWTVAPFASEEQIDRWSEAHGRFIATNGIRFEAK